MRDQFIKYNPTEVSWLHPDWRDMARFVLMHRNIQK